MNLPGWCFGLLWIPALAFSWYTWRGHRGCLPLLAALLFTALGFGAGHLVAQSRSWNWGWVGPWALGPALLGAGLGLLLLHLLLPATTPSHRGGRP